MGLQLDSIDESVLKLRSMPRGLERRYGFGHLHFITCSCYRRLPFLRSPRARDCFVQLLGETRAKFRFALVGYVVMPEHVHLLISEPAGVTPSDVMRELKQAVAFALLPPEERGGRESARPKQQRRFWQSRFYDFNVWSVRKKNEKLRYMHMNPVKRGLVRNPKDWPWSSYRAYMEIEPVLLSVNRVD
ncbi:MAG TPA: transposase [Candidatus Acidoferrales bacterium]|nr:transposase [Candidatus Acidoferrales bacterium]